MKRPAFVLVLGIFTILAGIVQTSIGGLLLAVRNDQEILTENKVTTNEVTGLAIALLIFGILTIIFAIGFLRGSRFARNFVGLSQVISIAGSIYAIAALDATRRNSAILSMSTSLVVLYFLFGTEKSKKFFAKS